MKAVIRGMVTSFIAYIVMSSQLQSLKLLDVAIGGGRI